MPRLEDSSPGAAFPRAISSDVVLDDSRTGGSRILRVHDTREGELAVFWLHGTPNLGNPPEPLAEASRRLGIRWIGYDRPGYGGSTPRPGRDVSSAAADVAALADHLGIDRFGVVGSSGGGAHALACAALLPSRVLAVAAISGLAPTDSPGLDWFRGMAPGGVRSFRAATAGRAAKEQAEAGAPPDEDIGFIDRDLAALKGEWAWFLSVVEPAIAQGPAGLIDDDLASVGPWGFDPRTITVPVLLLHGGADRMVPADHARWLADRIPGAQLRIQPEDGHISVLSGAPSALEWMVGAAG